MRFPDKSSFQFDIGYTFFTALRASSRDQPSPTQSMDERGSLSLKTESGLYCLKGVGLESMPKMLIIKRCSSM
jgi:hypothetical protein